MAHVQYTNLAIVALFIDEINTGDFWLQFKKKMKKIARWRCSTKIEIMY